MGWASKKRYNLICKWCSDPFIGKNSKAEYCCANCAQHAYLRNKMITTGYLIRCRICGKAIDYKNLARHFRTHDIILLKGDTNDSESEKTKMQIKRAERERIQSVSDSPGNT